MKSLRLQTLCSILALAAGLAVSRPARAGDNGRQATAPAFVEVRLNGPLKFSQLKPGDVLKGESAGNVFSGYRLMIPAGSRVSLRVSGMERRRKESGIRWPWPVRHFAAKDRNFPTFNLLIVLIPGGGETRLPVSLVTGYDEIHLAAQPANVKKAGKVLPPAGAKQHRKVKQEPGSTLELVIETNLQRPGVVAPVPAMSSLAADTFLPGIETLAAGTETKLALLDGLSASTSHPGDPFKAMLAEPLRLSSGEVLPQGSLFEGQVRKSVAPRWLSRPGSLYLTFNRLVLPTGASLPIAASVVGIATNRHSQMKVDSEGKLSGGKPGKKQLMADLGMSFAVSKVADDGLQLAAEALISTATDASTAGTARLVGMAIGGLFFIKRHGPDVVLPPYTMINIRFDRSPSLPAPEADRQGVQQLHLAQ